MKHRAFQLLSLLALCALLLGGCERRDVMTFSPETSEDNYERGKQFVRQGRNQEALSAFLKVISKRGDEAPESHLEVARIYQAHIKDYLAAIYYYRKYLELQPNSPQASLVRGMVDACTREFARTLPAHPGEDQSVRLGFMDQLGRLQRENDQLKAEIALLRAGSPAGPSSSGYSRGFDIPNNNPSAPAPVVRAVEEAPEEDSPISKAPLVQDNSGPQIKAPSVETSRVSPPTTTPTRPNQTQQAAQASQGGRRHVVSQGDTLYSLAQRYYSNRSRWRDIYQANRSVLRDENTPLKLGMELRIP